MCFEKPFSVSCFAKNIVSDVSCLVNNLSFSEKVIQEPSVAA